MSKHKNKEVVNKRKLIKETKHPTAVPRLEGKVKNTGIKPIKKPRKSKSGRYAAA